MSVIESVFAVGHDASRTGAPTTLRNLLRWARDERGVRTEIALLGRGPLVEDFRALGPVHVLPAALAGWRRAAAILGADGSGRRAERAEHLWLRRALAGAAEADVVLASSAASLWALAHLPSRSPPVVVHLHELDAILSALGGVDRLSPLVRRAELVLVPSPDVAELCARPVSAGGLDIAPGRIRRHPEPTATPRHGGRPVRRGGAAVVVGCGPVGWRKGTDLFVAVAHAVGPTVDGRPVRWRWIGGDSGDRTHPDVVDEIRLRGLADRLSLDGEVADGPERVAAGDLLVVCSREDPYPLVAVEAALAGTPVIGFRPGTTLLAEAGQDRRRVDDLDVARLADQVVEVLRDPRAGRRLAEPQARAALAATVPQVAPAIWADIERAASGDIGP